MSFERQHEDLTVRFQKSRNTGEILLAVLVQPTEHYGKMAQSLQLTKAQLYALVDDVAVADPDEWERRFPSQEGTERALRRLAGYFRQRAEANRKIGTVPGSKQNVHLTTMADTFDLAVTAVMEEIERLYEDQDPTDQVELMGLRAVNGSLNRRNR